MQKLYFLLTVFYAVSCESITLKKIYSESNKAIANRNVLKSEQIIQEYFITSNGSNSVWNIAQIMAKKVFNITYNIEDLIVMEQDIEKISRGFSVCKKMSKKLQKTFHCFDDLAITLEDAIVDFKSSLSTSRRNLVKYATMFMTMVVFQAHIALIARNPPTPSNASLKKKYSLIFEKINVHLNQFEFNSQDWRISASQVTPVTICEIRLRMWIEFQGACEKRWRRSLDDENEEEESFGMLLHNGNESLIESKVQGIGNPNSNRFKYRATVYDKFANYLVFQKDELVNSSTRGDRIFKLFKDGNEQRLQYNEGIAKKMKNFNEELVTIIRSIVESTIALF
ncbi:uncharacterized protein LOC105847641 isoform X1 [Hydra vulgaris]|uniref:Uncharacterized protein LOC105847641 isoform X1 n=1 Tax=Hydra vulgaris TaxID=6087 RepID=A0ABM4DG24_HYDVU